MSRDLSGGNPDPDLLPDFSLLMKNAGNTKRGYEDPPDDPELLRVLTRQYEGDKLPIGEVWLASGTFDAIATIMRKTIAQGAVIGVEDPCFMTTLGFARQAGYGTYPMPVDEEGVTPDGLRAALSAGVKAVILTPRAHNPMGGSWSDPRRAALQEVINAHPDVLLIEDDHYAVLSRYPAVTLVEPERPMWAIIRSVSKYIGPDLRLAAVNSSRDLSRACLSFNAFTSRWVSSILQSAVLNVLTAPTYEKLVAAAATAYNRRRQMMLDALEAQGIAAFGRDGLNVWIPVADEQATMRWLLESGWTVRAGSIFRVSSSPAIRVTISGIDKEIAEDFARSLAAVRRYDLAERGA
ncbi:aminotransferase class I/II-fold pyridoxal phosphate-dependent enzyme [Rhizobium sp. BT-175]|uniref:aminotransferase class I/II-fold pyridoxal phosphate-dependent enzyme n=1 Tax=Rhizobium sp. BT-175 TaxID=2986929 RepID=UPI0022359272|nr:aminotransferase class I/II-fold pyridoxal phosphate-dependent enzyme [Rhizobium sp. BT-175]MCV9947590.1 aminotransferase class I/II-fold pyridoxal phosphate-dependent enzyme [Rhizobium sp. BT-175]